MHGCSLIALWDDNVTHGTLEWLRDKENSAKHEKWKQTLMNYMKETKQMIKDKEEKHGFQRRMEWVIWIFNLESFHLKD